MEKESSLGITYDNEGNVDVAEDFLEPEFKKRLVDEVDLFDDTSILINWMNQVHRLTAVFIGYLTHI